MAQRSGERAGFNFTGPLGGLGNSMLQTFGVKQAGRDVTQVGGPSAKSPKGEGPKIEATGLPLPVLLWLGARLPFAAFTTILGLFTYLYHIVPIVPWLLAFFSIVFAGIVCWPPKYIGEKHRNLWDWGPMFSWLIAVGLAVSLGLLNYGILESWINTTFLREHTGVHANTNTMTVVDAGILTFADDVILDTTKSAGFKFWFYNYCAAPVVDKNAPYDAPVSFWAVGVGCCGSRADFRCDSAMDKTAHKGVPVRPVNLGPEITGHYQNAIRMAAAANDLEVAKEPIFVLWHKDPKAVGVQIWWLCTALVLCLNILGLCACCACQSGLTHINVMQQHSS